MEFWGIEVKPGQSVKVSPEDDHFLHISQGAFGEVKKDDKATMFVKVDDQKLSIGTLSTDKFPQIPFDLVFEKEFELSHTSKSSSVFFSGYMVFQPAEGDEMDFDSEEESEDEQVEEKLVPATKENAKAEAKDKKPKQVKIEPAAAKPIFGKSKKDEDSDDDESDDESDDDSEGQLIPIGSDDSDDDSSEEDDESDDEEEEETPKKPETGKKRAAESVLKTPASDKKAKVATPSGQKTGDKKGAVHVATPHPAKKAGKTPATNEKSPKSGGSVACKSCPKTFNSENALQAHSNAKHKAAA
ncbi:histone deacetylase HDT2-like [Lolium rigidum]|uniref:histone deacetylase HDT2-like n=1 Tax=Lolium rigidum TaxID=89674 RepID=UPI001F5C11A6|nr:histone deacetylase HDT2-like [Lolium rigidum]